MGWEHGSICRPNKWAQRPQCAREQHHRPLDEHRARIWLHLLTMSYVIHGDNEGRCSPPFTHCVLTALSLWQGQVRRPF